MLCTNVRCDIGPFITNKRLLTPQHRKLPCWEQYTMYYAHKTFIIIDDLDKLCMCMIG